MIYHPEAQDPQQPTTFPQTVEEWARPRRDGQERFAIAGFLMAMRRAGQMLAKEHAAVWDGRYQTYLASRLPPTRRYAARPRSRGR
jgi:hypothetical protein